MTPTGFRAETAVLKTLAAVCTLVALLFVAGLVFHHQVIEGSRWFVDVAGPWGVFFGFFLPDATALPLPHDVFLAAGRVGGLSFSTLVIWASAGSILGGHVAFFSARALAGTPWFEARSGAKVAQARALFERYGAVALAASAVTPLPYSLLAWASGGLGLSLPRFSVISLLRILRVAGYLWAIDKGFVEQMG